MNKDSYGDIMNDLSGIWRKTDASDAVPSRYDNKWVHPFEYALDTMIVLELCKGELRYPANNIKIIESGEQKRPGGRPRKNPVAEDKPKRPRGRPWKNPVATTDEGPKRPRGRPRKNPN